MCVKIIKQKLRTLTTIIKTREGSVCKLYVDDAFMGQLFPHTPLYFCPITREFCPAHPHTLPCVEDRTLP